jgi:carbon storage regulator
VRQDRPDALADFSLEGVPMLVLTRKIQETLVIDGNIIVTVVSVENGRVRLGIEAPRNISVRRGELEPRPQLQSRSFEVAGTNS